MNAFNGATNTWGWHIQFDTVAGTFMGVLLSNGFFTTNFSGLLKTPVDLPNVGSFAAFGSGTGNLIFDAPQFVVPEPAIFSIAAVAVGALIFWRRKENVESKA